MEMNEISLAMLRALKKKHSWIIQQQLQETVSIFLFGLTMDSFSLLLSFVSMDDGWSDDEIVPINSWTSNIYFSDTDTESCQKKSWFCLKKKKSQSN